VVSVKAIRLITIDGRYWSGATFPWSRAFHCSRLKHLSRVEVLCSLFLPGFWSTHTTMVLGQPFGVWMVTTVVQSLQCYVRDFCM